jgi:hypothetical protein
MHGGELAQRSCVVTALCLKNINAPARVWFGRGLPKKLILAHSFSRGQRKKKLICLTVNK